MTEQAPPGGWARCAGFDGRAVSPGDAKIIRDYAAFLAARESDPLLQWLELAGAHDGGQFWRAWYCPQPPPGRLFRVIGSEWVGSGLDGFWTQRILSIELAEVDAK